VRARLVLAVRVRTLRARLVRLGASARERSVAALAEETLEARGE
jgi:hypothetical protein